MKTCDSWSLHIMVALKEVSDLALAKFGITKFSCRCSTAQNKICTLL